MVELGVAVEFGLWLDAGMTLTPPRWQWVAFAKCFSIAFECSAAIWGCSAADSQLRTAVVDLTLLQHLAREDFIMNFDMEEEKLDQVRKAGQGRHIGDEGHVLTRPPCNAIEAERGRPPLVHEQQRPYDLHWRAPRVD
eukprot:COSAG01_NODE_13682_length_1548_cov_26.454106_1_plen_137_part_10